MRIWYSEAVLSPGEHGVSDWRFFENKSGDSAFIITLIPRKLRHIVSSKPRVETASEPPREEKGGDSTGDWRRRSDEDILRERNGERRFSGREEDAWLTT